MGGSTKKTEQKHEKTVTSPWEPARPAAEDVLARLYGRASDMELSGLETDAFDDLRHNALAGNPYAPQLGLLADDLFSGGVDRAGMARSIYDDYKAALAPFASGHYDRPGEDKELQATLDVARRKAWDATRGAFADAGRDWSGAEMNALGEGMTNAMAPILYDALNRAREGALDRKRSAIDAIHGAGNTALGLLANLDRSALANRLRGVDVAQLALNTRDIPQERLLELEARRRGIPLQNLGLLANLIVPMAQLGSTRTSNSTTVGEEKAPLGQQLLGGVATLGKAGAFGPSGWLFGGPSAMLGAGLLSDRRVKEDIAVVGSLHDGTPVYRFRYIGEPAMRIGLMADDVEKFAPAAVIEIGGFKAVDYELATDRSVRA